MAITGFDVRMAFQGTARFFLRFGSFEAERGSLRINFTSSTDIQRCSSGVEVTYGAQTAAANMAIIPET